MPTGHDPQQRLAEEALQEQPSEQSQSATRDESNHEQQRNPSDNQNQKLDQPLGTNDGSTSSSTNGFNHVVQSKLLAAKTKPPPPASQATTEVVARAQSLGESIQRTNKTWQALLSARTVPGDNGSSTSSRTAVSNHVTESESLTSTTKPPPPASPATTDMVARAQSLKESIQRTNETRQALLSARTVPGDNGSSTSSRTAVSNHVTESESLTSTTKPPPPASPATTDMVARAQSLKESIQRTNETRQALLSARTVPCGPLPSDSDPNRTSQSEESATPFLKTSMDAPASTHGVQIDTASRTTSKGDQQRLNSSESNEVAVIQVSVGEKRHEVPTSPVQVEPNQKRQRTGDTPELLGFSGEESIANNNVEEQVAKPPPRGILKNNGSSAGSGEIPPQDQLTEEEQAQVHSVEQWLKTKVFSVGTMGADNKLRQYAVCLVNLGLHSVEMIQDLCSQEDVDSFDWMELDHKKVFVDCAGLQQEEQAQVHSVEQWLKTKVFSVGTMGADNKLRQYAVCLVNLGLHSVEMIQDLCSQEDVDSFDWMELDHKKVFVDCAGLQQEEQAQVHSVEQWL
eukprot:CAMPEP_0168760280 /NCGR_PEP_ID=MMETSP0724-20121128/22674_1 /TAXON_ID=265536 /ORGANISM="Amphiprora sp., Strain CCMP467" /LENGTH=570 /DNA_ID=CAMNT_0008809263 /DNA_START=130 /DNA_END=1839 /DNA_ORIENTATION=+